jgi:glycerophosphoryl diester phosphodiesterase
VPQVPPANIFEHPQPIAIAHRGGAAEAPENTMAAFANAAGLGFHYMEIDVQATRDNVPVVFHDGELGRLTGLSGSVDDLTWEALGEARVQGREPIPLLEEVLGSLPDLRFIIELKSDRVAEPLAEVIARMGALGRVCIGSFDDSRIARMRRLLGPGLCTSLGRRGVARLRLASLGLPVGGFAAAAADRKSVV